MNELWKKDGRDKREKDKRVSEGEKKKDRRNIYLVLGFSKFWGKRSEPLHKSIDRIMSTNNLPWLQTRMAYQKYRNLGELLHLDLCNKLHRHILSLDLMERPYNCPNRCKINGRCPYEGKCRTTCLVFKVKSTDRGAIYISRTQRTLKERINIQ